MSVGKCPYCFLTVHFSVVQAHAPHGFWFTVAVAGKSKKKNVSSFECPSCRARHLRATVNFLEIGDTKQTPDFPLWPLNGGREAAPREVPSDIAEDYREACAVLDVSPQSSAALARRILQRVLVDCGGADAKKRLDRQIEDVAPNLPSYLSENLHFLRGVGNFAAHAQQDSAGTIIKVDREEAEATLDVISGLFEHYYVAPAKARAARAKFASEKVEPTGNKHLAEKIDK